MTSQYIGFVLVFLPLSLVAQPLQDRSVVPLNNWPAPHQVVRPQLRLEQRVLTPQMQLPGSATADALIFVPVKPCRLADTRPGLGYPGLGSTPLAALTPRTLLITGSCGTLSTAAPEAFSLNVTVVPPSSTRGGYLLVYPNPVTPVPLAASLTWNPGAVLQSATVVAAASPDGSVNVVVNFPADVVIDINGYYAPPTDLEGNTALGSGAMAAASSATAGDLNTAFGNQALFSNTNGGYNTALGFSALWANTIGFGSTALGANALNNATGGENIAVGHMAGYYLTTGNSNIMIGNQGTVADDSIIRIGTHQAATYIAGIAGNSLTGAANVVISPTGQLGVQSAPSSRRYKEDIRDMGDASRGLLRLRPVTFHYKKPDPEGSKPLEYGLIAEEVDAVYPELVVRGPDAQVETVQYSKLPAMLLNELQKQDATIRKLEARIGVLESQLAKSTAKKISDRDFPASAGGH
jgi:hypothetical protein